MFLSRTPSRRKGASGSPLTPGSKAYREIMKEYSKPALGGSPLYKGIGLKKRRRPREKPIFTPKPLPKTKNLAASKRSISKEDFDRMSPAERQLIRAKSPEKVPLGFVPTEPEIPNVLKWSNTLRRYVPAGPAYKMPKTPAELKNTVAQFARVPPGLDLTKPGSPKIIVAKPRRTYTRKKTVKKKPGRPKKKTTVGKKRKRTGSKKKVTKRRKYNYTTSAGVTNVMRAAGKGRVTFPDRVSPKFVRSIMRIQGSQARKQAIALSGMVVHAKGQNTYTQASFRSMRKLRRRVRTLTNINK